VREEELKQQVDAYLKLRKGRDLVMRLNSGKVKIGSRYIQMHEEGTADYVVFCPTPHWIELKGEGQRTKKERAEKQQEFAEKVTALGHKHLTATSLEQVIKFLD